MLGMTFLPSGLTRTPTGPHSNGIAAYFFDICRQWFDGIRASALDCRREED